MNDVDDDMTDMGESSESDDGWEEVSSNNGRRRMAPKNPRFKNGSLALSALNKRNLKRHHQRLELPDHFKDYQRRCANSVTVMDDLRVPKYVRIAAAMGPKFEYPVKPRIKPVDILNTRTAIDQLTSCIIENAQAKHIKHQLITELNDYFQSNKSKSKSMHANNPIIRSLKNTYMKCKQFLCRNKHIMIAESDKGKCGIVCLKATVQRKLEEHVEAGVNDGTYKKVEPRQDESTDAMIERIHTESEAAYNNIIKRINVYIEGGTRKAEVTDSINIAKAQRKTSGGTRYEHWLANGYIQITGDRKLGLKTPERARLASEAYCMSQMYVTMKVHKGSAYPIRPIIAAPAAMGASAEIWILQKLEKLVENTIKNEDHPTFDARFMSGFGFVANNSQAVVNGIHRFGLKPGHRIVSMDLVSMYTNIKQNMAFDAIQAEYSKIETQTSVPVQLFMQLLRTLTSSNAHFAANGRIYTQAKGLPMGGKLSKILSEIITAKATISMYREATRRGFQFSFIYKYVDDYLIGMNMDNDGCNIETLKTILEQCIPGMKVTHEEEADVDGALQLKYLEFTTIREEHCNIFETIWSRQKYASFRTVSAFSDIQQQQKHNTIAETLRKAIAYSTKNMVRIALSRAVDWIAMNGYAASTIMRILQKMPEYQRLPAELQLIDINAPDTTTSTALAAQITHAAPTPTTSTTQIERRRFHCNACGTSTRARITANRTNDIICGAATCGRVIWRTGPATATPAIPEQATRPSTRPDTTRDENERLDTTMTIDRNDGEPTAKRAKYGPNAVVGRMRPQDKDSPRMWENTPEYIQIPALKGLDKRLNQVNQAWGIQTKFACAAHTNQLATVVKDKMATKLDSMVTYQVRCHTCRKNLYFNAISTTAMGHAKEVEAGAAHAGHDADWRAPRIIAKYPTIARANRGLVLIRAMENHENSEELDDITTFTKQMLVEQ